MSLPGGNRFFHFDYQLLPITVQDNRPQLSRGSVSTWRELVLSLWLSAASTVKYRISDLSYLEEEDLYHEEGTGSITLIINCFQLEDNRPQLSWGGVSLLERNWFFHFNHLLLLLTDLGYLEEEVISTGNRFCQIDYLLLITWCVTSTLEGEGHYQEGLVLSLWLPTASNYRIIDLSYLEEECLYLEGTGSIVFDYRHRIAYAAISDRTSPAGKNNILK